MFCGPRRLDKHQQAKVLEASLESYKRAGAKLAEWLAAEGRTPSTADEWDDLLVEYKNVCALSKTAFEQTVASVEFFFPRYCRFKI